jgi:teichuronic acid biosynthesis glycosyltransferase TuaG
LGQAVTVSIVTPCYNLAPYIGACIASVHAQTCDDWEMLVVDDASTDASAELVAEGARRDPRVRLVRSRQNRGAGEARNVALAQAKGRYVAFLDGDDAWAPRKLEVQLEFMASSGIAFSYTGSRRVDAAGNLIRDVRPRPRFTYRDLLKDTGIVTSSVILDRSMLGPLRFDPRRSRQDLVLWLSILSQGVVAEGILEPLTTYRVTPGSVSGNKAKAMAGTWKVLRAQPGLGPLARVCCFANYVVHAAIRNRDRLRR